MGHEEQRLLRSLAGSVDDNERMLKQLTHDVAQMRRDQDLQHRKTRQLIVEATVQIVSAVQQTPTNNLGRLRLLLNGMV